MFFSYLSFAETGVRSLQLAYNHFHAHLSYRFHWQHEAQAVQHLGFVIGLALLSKAFEAETQARGLLDAQEQVVLLAVDKGSGTVDGAGKPGDEGFFDLMGVLRELEGIAQPGSAGVS